MARVRAVLRGPLARILDAPISDRALKKLGDCIVKELSKESKRYFAKRGWSGKDPMGGEPIWDSFSWKIRGKSTLEITSTFYGMGELARGDIPARRMTWLTQENKEKHPADFKLTPRERKLRMRRDGSVKKGTRLPLIVPVRGNGGTVEFRVAPLKTANAWVHPGIARFSFFETAIRKWRERCAEVIGKTLQDMLKEA